MSDESGALWMPNANYFPNREGHKPLYIVLHSTAGGSSAQAIANYYTSTQGGSNPVSSHYIVGVDGVIVQTVLEEDGAWANGYISGPSGVSGDGIGNGYHDVWWDSGVNPNNLSISVEHVKSANDNSNQLTPTQQQASFTLIQHLCQRHNIPMRKADASGGITFHGAIDPVNRQNCPGPYPWQALYTFLGASTVATLENFPMISQLDNDINAQFDCVPTSLAAALQYLTGIKFSGSEIKDAVYGVGYQGVTAPDAYIGYCATHGVLLSPYNGTNVALVAAAKEQIAQGHPVLLTEIDPYMPTSTGATHVVAAYACNADSVTVMDPYIDQGVTKTDQEWEANLQSGQIWIVEKGALVLDISQVSNYFTETTKDTRWHCAKTNQDIAYGILTYYRTCTSVALNGMSQYGLPTSTEQGVPGVPGATFQVFERGIIVYDPNHAEDSVPGVSGPCYPGHLNKFLQAAPVSANVTSALSTLHSILATTATLQAATGALNTGLQSVISELGVS